MLPSEKGKEGGFNEKGVEERVEDRDGNREVGMGSEERKLEQVRGVEEKREGHAHHGFGGDGSGERVSARP